MSTTTGYIPNEHEGSQERRLNLERLQKVNAFIQDVLSPAGGTLGEYKAQQDEVKKFESRPYQLEAWDALWQAREAGVDRGLVHLATGLGKTSVAVFDYAKFREEQAAKGETARGLFVVHQNAILDQADERFNEVLPHLLPGVGMSRFVNQSDNLPTGEVVFASFQALNRGVYKFEPDHFDYIVYDEAHHIEAKTYKRVVEYFKPKFQLGLTATPERGDGKDITDHFGETLYSKTLPEGMAEGYLADVHYRLMLDEETKQLLQSGFKPKNMTELNRIFEFELKHEDVADTIRTAQQEIRDKTGLDKVKTIIFSPNIFDAAEMTRLMNGEGYHSGIGSEKNRKSVLEAFRNGDFETIVTRDMFNEGVDIPDARLIVFLRSTQSKTIFEQQLGRGLRKTNDKDDVVALDFVANVERMRLLRELADEISQLGPEGRSGTKAGARGNLKIGNGKSDFEFEQQVVDILALYDYFREKQESKTDWSKWSNDDLVVLAKQLSPDVPMTVPLMTKFFREGEFPSPDTIRDKRRFGSMPNFQRACGFEVSHKIDWSLLTNEEVIDLAKSIEPDTKLTHQRIQQLSREGEFPSYNEIEKRFGSVVNFQKACGFENWSDWSNEEMVELAQRLSPDEPLKTADINLLSKSGKYTNMDAIMQRFGSMPNFQRACGFEVEEKRSWSHYSKDEIIDIAKGINPNAAISSTQINELSKAGRLPSLKYIKALFGSKEEFEKACGFERQETVDWTKWSNSELVELAQQLSPEGPMAAKVIKSLAANNEFPSYNTIYVRFGSLQEFHIACGFDPIISRPDWASKTNESIVELARSVYPQGVFTTAVITDLAKAGKLPSTETIAKRFGSISHFQQVTSPRTDSN